MEQPYANPCAQGTGPSIPLPAQGGGVPGVIIVDPRFCASYPVEMAIVRKLMKLTSGNFTVTDVKGNLLFKVKHPVVGFHEKRILLDGYGSPVVTMKEKIMSLHDRWQVFKGESTEQRDLLYTVKRSSITQLKTTFEVFLCHNRAETICDFRVKESSSERSYIVYAGQSDSNIVARMHKKTTVQSVFLGKDNFSVTVYPNVDYAFIASLIVILEYVNRPTS